MNSQRPTQAEATEAILQEAIHTGVPVLIPGAFEVRAGRPGVHTQAAAEHPAVVRPRTSGVADRQRLVYELEGGGAPSQRRIAGHRTFMGRLFQLLLYGHDARPSREYPKASAR